MKKKTTKRKKKTASPPPSWSNRTGIAASPKNAKQLIDDARAFPPSTGADPTEASEMRREYILEAPVVGTVPPPSSLRAMGTTVVQALRGNKASVLLDKLGERLAFERTGVRLYESLLAKLDARGSFAGGPTHSALARHLEEELEHFQIVRSAIEELGADPTAMTPSADITAVASTGLCKVITDPRTTMAEALQAIHIAELTDTDGWRLLVDLCLELGLEDVAERFRTPLIEEEEHLMGVRRWLNAYAMNAAHGREEGEPEEMEDREAITARIS